MSIIQVNIFNPIKPGTEVYYYYYFFCNTIVKFKYLPGNTSEQWTLLELFLVPLLTKFLLPECLLSLFRVEY